MRVIALVMLVCLLASQAAAAGAAPQFRSVSVAGSTYVLGGGFDLSGNRMGVLSRSSDDGASWSPTVVPYTWMYGVSAAGGGWGVSSYDERAWQWASPWVASPVTAVTNVNFEDVASVSDTVAFVVGGEVAGEKGELSSIWTTSNGGAVWTKTHEGTPPPLDSEGNQPAAAQRIFGVDAVPGLAVAVGNEYPPDSLFIGTPKPIVLRSVNDGGSWASATTLPSLSVALRDVDALDTSTVWAVGGGRTLLKSSNGGVSWTSTVFNRQFTPVAVAIDPYGVAVIDSQTAIAVGAISASATEARGVVARTTNGGTSWSYYTPTGLPVMRSVAMRDAQHGVAVGDSETILRTSDGGVTWTALPKGAPSLSLTAPAAGFSLGSGSLSITGASSDAGSRVALVQTQIWRSNGTYWNGSAWTASPAWLDASSADGWAHFSYAGPQLDGLTGSLIEVRVRAVDAGGNVSALTRASASVASKLTATAPQAVAYGGTATIKAYLRSPQGVLVSGATRKVTLQRYVSGKWSTLTSASSSTGVFTLSAKPTTKTTYRVVYYGDSSFKASTSSSFSIAPGVSLSAPKVSSRSGRTFNLYGYLKPRHTAGSRAVRVYGYRYERQSNGSYKWVSRKYVYASISNYSSYSRYAARMTVPYAGKWMFKAYAAADSAHSTTWSGASSSYTVK